MNTANRSSSFMQGLLCGVALAAAAMLFAANSATNTAPTAAQPAAESAYFVTGDAFSATVWRLDSQGTLTCVSHNLCEEPSVAPQRYKRQSSGQVPTGSRTPAGQRVPGGPSVPPPDQE